MKVTELARLAGVTPRQITFWIARGHLKSVLTDGPGTAIERRQEIRILRIMAALVLFGFTPERAATLARDHVESGEELSTLSIGSVAVIKIAG